jgi:hypothetical protein
MVTSFSGGRSRSIQREPPTMGKQLVNFITCGCESLTCIFEISVYLVLTATATVNLENVLNYNNPDIVWSNSDSQNIYIKVVLKKSMRTGIAPKG